jgi:hypothetical protein
VKKYFLSPVISKKRTLFPNTVISISIQCTIPPRDYHGHIGGYGQFVELSQGNGVLIGIDQAQHDAQTIFGGKIFNAPQYIIAVQQMIAQATSKKREKLLF